MKTFYRIEKELGILVTFMKPGGLKLNLDAAARTGFPMAAVTGRNDQGTTLHLWTSMHLTSNPLVAEARAALLAVQQASCLNQEQILFEGDALLVCNAINDDSIEPDWNGRSTPLYETSEVIWSKTLDGNSVQFQDRLTLKLIAFSHWAASIENGRVVVKAPRKTPLPHHRGNC
jgi:hypothetical protein